MATTVRVSLDRESPLNRSGFALTQDYHFATAADASSFVRSIGAQAKCEVLATLPTTTPEIAFRHFWLQAKA